MSLRHYLLLLLLVTTVLGASLIFWNERWHSRLDMREAMHQRGSIAVLELDHVRMGFARFLVTYDLVVYSEISYLAGDARGQLEGIKAELGDMDGTGAFAPGQREFIDETLTATSVLLGRILDGTQREISAAERDQVDRGLEAVASMLDTWTVNAREASARDASLISEEKRSQETSLVIGLVAYVFFVLLLVVLASRRIGRPIAVLARLAEHQVGSPAPLEFADSGPREFRDISNSVHRLIRSLGDTVGERTHLLEEANIRLTKIVDELSRAEGRYHELVDRLEEIVFEYDDEERFTFLNTAWTKLLGFEIGESIGSPVVDFIAYEDQSSTRRLLAMGRAEDSPGETAEVQIRDKKGDLKWFELSLASGTGQTRQGSFRDLTESRRANALARLTRYFSPHVAKQILEGEVTDSLKSRRREITVVFIDLRGFTTFAETSEPEEVMSVLGEFHGDMGSIILDYEGTLERFTGDGMMIFFNDPVEVPDPTERAIRMSLEMQDQIAERSRDWRKRGWDLTAGIGIAKGFATIGAIGFEGRVDYGAIGTVTNLAARLCDHAREFEILISERCAVIAKKIADVEEAGVYDLKGFAKPIRVFRVQEPAEEGDDYSV